MMHPIRHYSGFSISAEQIKKYHAIPMEKRLELLYLGNLFRKAFCEMLDDELLKETSAGYLAVLKKGRFNA